MNRRKVLALAGVAPINGRADALVTRNFADFADAARRFGLRMVRPGELLKELKS